VKRGEIRWYQFHKPDKKRPVLILTRDSVLEYLSEVTVVPITSTIRDIPSEVLLGKEDGMKADCVINFDHMQTVSVGRIGGYIATLSPDKWSSVKKALLFAMGFGG
jgi:mRNA interferase MazF